MSGYVAVQTPGHVTWFESEQHYYDGLPTLILQFSPSGNNWFVISRRPTTRAITRGVGPVLHRLSNFPTDDVSQWMTHTVSEPGAPLEPITREEVPA